MNQKTIYIIGGSVLAITLTYFGVKIYQANKDKKSAELEEQDLSNDNDEKNGVLGAGQQGSQSPKKSNNSFPMKVGSYGNRVMILQSALNNLGASLTVDGKFGQNTYKAISDYSGEWGRLCRIGFSCGLTKDEYDAVLKKAEINDWDEGKAKILADKNWLPFSNSNDSVYYNLTMN